jgi:hypothetical protein
LGIRSKRIKSVAELVKELRQLRTESPESEFWYRGQAKSEWKLVPSLARTDGFMQAEPTSIKVFKQRARPYLTSIPSNEWEWLFLMQHYRVETRLLDWTESPLTALYFALSENKNDEAALWALDPRALNHESGHNRGYARDILAFGVDPTLDDYLTDKAYSGTTTLKPVAAIGPRNSSRMAAQTGSFTKMHGTVEAVEDVGKGKHVKKFTIKKEDFASILDDLDVLAFTEESIYPDLDRAAQMTRRVFPHA